MLVFLLPFRFLDESIEIDCSAGTNQSICCATTVWRFLTENKKNHLFLYRTLFDVQNVWGRTAVDTQKPIDTTPLTEMPRQDVRCSLLFIWDKSRYLSHRKPSVHYLVFLAIYSKSDVVVSLFLHVMRCNQVRTIRRNGKLNGIQKNVGKIHWWVGHHRKC